MPMYNMKEIWTPLKWVGVKLFKSVDEKTDYYIKIGKNPRKKSGKPFESIRMGAFCIG